MKKPMVQEIMRPVVCLFLICFLVAAALAVTNLVTAPRIAALQQESAAETMKEVLSAKEYKEKTLSGSYAGVSFFEAIDEEDQCVGYVVTTAAAGYGGDVQVMTGVDLDGKVTAVRILDCSNETPGLGQNAKDAAFTDQFAGQSGELVVKEDIDALTGATITSKAVVTAVNQALAAVRDNAAAD